MSRQYFDKFLPDIRSLFLSKIISKHFLIWFMNDSSSLNQSLSKKFQNIRNFNLNGILKYSSEFVQCRSRHTPQSLIYNINNISSYTKLSKSFFSPPPNSHLPLLPSQKFTASDTGDIIPNPYDEEYTDIENNEFFHSSSDLNLKSNYLLSNDVKSSPVLPKSKKLKTIPSRLSQKVLSLPSENTVSPIDNDSPLFVLLHYSHSEKLKGFHFFFFFRFTIFFIELKNLLFHLKFANNFPNLNISTFPFSSISSKISSIYSAQSNKIISSFLYDRSNGFVDFLGCFIFFFSNFMFVKVPYVVMNFWIHI
jgi:hypothetical protein